MTRLTPLFVVLFLLMFGACRGSNEATLPQQIVGKSLIVEKEDLNHSNEQALYIYNFKKFTYTLVEGKNKLETGCYIYHYDPYNQKATLSFRYEREAGQIQYEAELIFFNSSSGAWRVRKASADKIHPHEEGTFTFVVQN